MIRTAGALVVIGGLAAWAWAGVSAARGVHDPPVVLMEPSISWIPSTPPEGRLFTIRVTASRHTPILGVHGRAGGEELHFARAGQGVFESLAAVPVGSEASIEARIRVVYASGTEEHFEESIPVTAGLYRHEELTVAPRFGAPLVPADRARLERDRAMAAMAAERAHRTPRIRTDSVTMPRPGRVTSEFGNGRIFNGQVSSRHMGLDLQGHHGDTVVAAARGVVELVEPFLLAGNVVYLNHGGGLLSAYFHLSDQLVSAGDTVDAGMPIGLVGATGRVTGPHLHWVVRYGTTSVDPRSLIDVLDP